MMTCTHRFDAEDMCIDCGYDDGLRYMQPTHAVLRLAALPRPDGEQHDMDPPHALCLGDDPCVCIQLVACERRALDAAREALDALPTEQTVKEGVSEFWVEINHALAAIDAQGGKR